MEGLDWANDIQMAPNLETRCITRKTIWKYGWAGQEEYWNGQGEEEVGRQQNEVGAKSARTSFFTGVMVIYAYLMMCTNEQIGLVHLDLASN